LRDPHLREPEVRDHGRVVSVEQDVRRFKVAMQDPAAVCVVDGVRHARDQRSNVVPLAGERSDAPVEAAAFGELHAEQRQAGMLADLVDRQDAGVIEARHGFDFATEAVEHAGHRQQLRQHDLERDHAPGVRLARAVDDTHAAAGDFVEQLVVADALPLDPQPFVATCAAGGAFVLGEFLLRRCVLESGQAQQAGAAEPGDARGHGRAALRAAQAGRQGRLNGSHEHEGYSGAGR